jgi:hypothetical protein
MTAAASAALLARGPSMWSISECAECRHRATLLTDGAWFYVQCFGPDSHTGPSSLNRLLAIGRWNTRQARARAACHG